MTPNNEKGDFSTIRIWREDKEKLDAKKVHDQQGIHEVVRALILTDQINDKVIIPVGDGDFLAVSKSNPKFKETIRAFREQARKIVEGKD